VADARTSISTRSPEARDLARRRPRGGQVDRVAHEFADFEPRVGHARAIAVVVDDGEVDLVVLQRGQALVRFEVAKRDAQLRVRRLSASSPAHDCRAAVGKAATRNVPVTADCIDARSASAATIAPVIVSAWRPAVAGIGQADAPAALLEQFHAGFPFQDGSC